MRQRFPCCKADSNLDRKMCDHEAQAAGVRSAVHSHRLTALLTMYGPVSDGGTSNHSTNGMEPFYSVSKKDLYTNVLETIITQRLDTSSLLI